MTIRKVASQHGAQSRAATFAELTLLRRCQNGLTHAPIQVHFSSRNKGTNHGFNCSPRPSDADVYLTFLQSDRCDFGRVAYLKRNQKLFWDTTDLS